jgi:hypothetical protein
MASPEQQDASDAFGWPWQRDPYVREGSGFVQEGKQILKECLLYIVYTCGILKRIYNIIYSIIQYTILIYFDLFCIIPRKVLLVLASCPSAVENFLDTSRIPTLYSL